MMRSDELLRSYLRLIRRASGAESVSIYLAGNAASHARPILLSVGEGAGVPELEDAAAAASFCERAERELAQRPSRNAWRQLPSAVPEGLLLRVPAIEELLAAPPQSAAGGGRRERRKGPSPPPPLPTTAWLGFRFDPHTVPAPAALPLPPAPGKRRQGKDWAWLLAVGGVLAWHTRSYSAILHDPVSRLPGRAELQTLLREATAEGPGAAGPVGLLLINPDDFDLVNERFGREGGDSVIREIAGRLGGVLRRRDFVCRYGGAVFGVALRGAARSEVTAVAAKLRAALTEGAYLEGAVRLSFSLGVAISGPRQGGGGDPSLELIRRGDRALNAAKLAGGGRTVIWRPDAELEEVGNLDRLSGIFTANLAKDYRNMLLLWDTVSIVASSAEFDRLATRAVERLATTFRPDRVELLADAGQGGTRLVHGTSRNNGGSRRPGKAAQRAREERRQQLLAAARRSGEPAQAAWGGREAGGTVGCAVPLTSGEQHLGCLYLEGRSAVLRLDPSDLIFLKALAGQLAVALDRARLAEEERTRQELERRQLRTELNELRRAMQQARLIYRSAEMASLLAAARRVAATDATVLVAGESGTGKELVARTIHELSARRRKPLVVVDCGAISTSLIDSELFGHAKGAFTGAERRSAGRLAEADGGTVLLDEIGELPLEVQSKLLRFVQEKQFTPVGSNQVRRVDVRVVAVTNSDLAAEVAAGRFREDLYYRLKVVHLVVPPLRERPDDIRCLAQHFVEQFAVQYQKGVRGLSPEAEELLLRHPWPGNVRELQNRILQAVVLCEGAEVGGVDLGLVPVRPPVPATAAPAGEPAAATGGGHPGPSAAWQALAAVLGRWVDELQAERGRLPVPLGKWLEADLVVAAYGAAGRVSSAAAAALGIPETTFRRRLRKALASAEAGLAQRPRGWEAVRSRIEAVAWAGNPDGEDLVQRARSSLLAEILARLPDEVSFGAALMGVTEPTFRRWAADLGTPAAAAARAPAAGDPPPAGTPEAHRGVPALSLG